MSTPALTVHQQPQFLQIALQRLDDMEMRILPIAVGGKQPLIKWKNSPIDVESEDVWATHVVDWVNDLAKEFPNANACVIAKPNEFCFIDADTYRELVAGYEAWSGEEFPVTYTTSARDNRAQIHFLQTDATRAAGNIVQFEADGIDLSFRQHNYYVLAEGSRHKSGSVYARTVDERVVPMPDKLVEYILFLAKKAGKKLSSVFTSPTGNDSQELIPHGQINPWQVKRAGHYRSMGLTPEEIEPILIRETHKYCAPPIDNEEARKVARSSANFKEAQPSQPVVLDGKVLTQPEPQGRHEAVSSNDDEEKIPAFDETVITGIFREVVDMIVGGTTAPRQFPFLFAKVYFGARMAVGGMLFEGISDSPNIYGAAVGKTGTSKGLAWDRGTQVLMPTCLLEKKVKVIHSADSGAGLRDAFFDPPPELPIFCIVDEIRSLGHKAGEKKNPEIWDTFIELANSHSISRVKAAKTAKVKANKTHEAAYLAAYMCGQDGKAFMSSAPDRTDMGLWDRFYPEYADPIEPGNLPFIDVNLVMQLFMKLEKLPFTGRMTMGEGVQDAIDAFWGSQPKEVKVKVRFRGHLLLDMYFAAWSQGRTVATIEDLDVAIRIFQRQIVIRRVHFSEEVPDKVGFYIGKIKKITESMRKRLNKGETMDAVAMSERDFQTDTRAYADNEIVTFNTAWRNFQPAHLMKHNVKAKNGQMYVKWIPEPYEDETWQ